MNDDREIRRIERERRRREDELLLLLLALMLRANREAAVAAAHDYDPAPVIRRNIAGDADTGHKGAAPIIARAMAQAHRDGFRRAGLMAGTRDVARTDAGLLAELAAMYLGHAEAMTAAMVATLTDAVMQAIADARAEGVRGRGLRKPIADAFDISGYSRHNPYAVDVGVERAIVTAHNLGILAAVFGGAAVLASLVTGLRHRSVLDSVTTTICEMRDGLQLPLDDPYWMTGCPPLHFSCRSVLIPLFGEFTPSDWRPAVPPMAGFGYAPVWLFGIRV